MPRSYRSIIAALVGWLILVGADAPQPPAPYPAPDYRAGDALINISAALERREKDEARSPDKRPCQGIAQDRDSDLCAQWTAANAAKKDSDWADLTGWLSVGSFILSIIGLFALIYTLSQTNKTLRIAQKDRATATRRAISASEETQAALEIARKNAESALIAANSAKESNEIAVQSMIAANRAYINLRFKSVKEELRDDGLRGMQFNFSAKNLGKSPAKKVKSLTRYQVTEDGSAFIFNDPTVLSSEADIAPGIDILPFTFPITLDHINNTMHKKSRIFIQCYIEYSDFFDGTPRRHTVENIEIAISNFEGRYRYRSFPYGPGSIAD
jgi:hypothetical protein